MSILGNKLTLNRRNISIAFENNIESTKDVWSILLNQSNNRSSSVTLFVSGIICLTSSLP